MSKKKKQSLTAKMRVASGQVGLLVSLLLIAFVLGLLPNRQNSIRHGRATLAESVALNVSSLIAEHNVDRLEAILGLLVQRNHELLSVAVTKEDEDPLVAIGPHSDQWEEMMGEYSSDTQLRVPIFSGTEKWGQLEMRFISANSFGGLDFEQSQLICFIAFMAASGFFVFYMYLGKMLKHLDPSRAIPQRVRSALDTMAEGLLVLDLKGQIVLANSAFADLFGKDVDSLLGRNASDFQWVHTDGTKLGAGEAPWETCLLSGEPHRNSHVQLQRDERRLRTFIVNCSPIMSNGTKHGGVLVSFDDVTDLEEKKVELGKAKDEAIAANRAKSAFLANMSHEIRTPMNAILGFTDVLRRGYGKHGTDSKQYLNTIHSSGQHLLELINDILDLSKVEAGNLEVEQIECHPHVVVHDVVQVLGVKAREKNIDITFSATTVFPETIQSDPSRLRQIITNLVGNAIKFTDEGSVDIVISLDAEKSQLQIEIQDSGIGMTTEQAEKIFDPFAQADSSVTRRFGGTGLGLTISKQFAEALGGSISVVSQPGQGSVFTVRIDTGPLDGTLMLQPDQVEDTNVIDSEEQFTWQFESKRVLVVDDGKENRDLVMLVLREVGIETDAAENGKIGSEMAMANDYDLVLMDMQMPVMDGYAATRYLRQQGYETPIFALTAHAMKGFEKGCLDAGCTGYLTKPIEIDVLLETLGKVLDGRKVPKQASPPVTDQPLLHDSASDDCPSTDSLDSQGEPLYSTLPMDVAEFREIVADFIPRLDERLGEMHAAWSKGKLSDLADLAHWLKGCGGTVGFPAFTDPAARLEAMARHEIEPDDDQCLIIEGILTDLYELSTRIRLDPDSERCPETQQINSKKKPNAEADCDGTSTTVSHKSDDITPLSCTLPLEIPEFVEIVQEFVPRLHERLDAIRKKLAAGDLQELADLAHWLKGCGGTVGFSEFTEPASALEKLARSGSNRGASELVDQLQSLANRIEIPAAVGNG